MPATTRHEMSAADSPFRNEQFLLDDEIVVDLITAEGPRLMLERLNTRGAVRMNYIRA
jgi:hypothetical protein